MKLSTVLKELGIQAVLFDLDDTLIGTHAVFKMHVEQMMERLIALLVPGMATEEDLWKEYNAALGIAIQRHNVVPELLWPSVLDLLRSQYPQISQQLWKDSIDTLMQIYTHVPEVFPDTLETLAELSGKVKLGIVTHAAEDWTMLKLRETGLLPFANHIQFSPTNRPKDNEAWRLSAQSLLVDARHCLAVGDNIKGDILAAQAAGVGHLALFRRDDGWKLVSSGEVPEQAVIIDSLGNLAAALRAKHRE